MDHLITRPKANNLSDKKSPRNPLDSLFAANDSVVASITADRKTEQYAPYKSSGNRQTPVGGQESNAIYDYGFSKKHQIEDEQNRPTQSGTKPSFIKLKQKKESSQRLTDSINQLQYMISGGSEVKSKLSTERAKPDRSRISDKTIEQSEEQISIRQTEGSMSSKLTRSRHMMGPLSFQKLVRTVTKVCQRSIVRLIIERYGKKMQNMCYALDSLDSVFKRNKYHSLIESVVKFKEYPIKIQVLQSGLNTVEKLLIAIRRSIQAQVIFKILSHSLEKTNHISKSLFKDLENNPQLVTKPRQLLDLANAIYKRNTAIGALIRKKALSQTQSARRALYHLKQALDIGSIGHIGKLSLTLRRVLDIRSYQNSLRAFYSIKAAGGRFDKLAIILRKHSKIYFAKMKYSYKKLNLWARFKAGKPVDSDNLRTIIVRTVEPAEDMRTAQLVRMFQRKGIDTINSSFKNRLIDTKKEAFQLIKRELLYFKGLQALSLILDGSIRRKSLGLGWIELTINDMRQQSARSVVGLIRRNSAWDSPGTKVRISATLVNINSGRGALKNPMFKYIEQRQSSNENLRVSNSTLTQNHSNELEILKTGLDLDTHLGLAKLFKAKFNSTVLQKELKN